MSSKEELLVHRAEVEKLFLSLARQRDIYRSTFFLDAHAREKVGICENNRWRDFRSLAEGRRMILGIAALSNCSRCSNPARPDPGRVRIRSTTPKAAWGFSSG